MEVLSNYCTGYGTLTRTCRATKSRVVDPQNTLDSDTRAVDFEESTCVGISKIPAH